MAKCVILIAVALGACDPDGFEASEDEQLVDDAQEADDEELALVGSALAPEPVAEDDEVSSRSGFDLAAASYVGNFTWKNWISDEDPASTCGTGQLVSGFDCSGGYCDNVRIECYNFGGTPGESYWSNWISEEAPNNYYQCPGNQYMSGVTCSGEHCDNLSVECTITTLAKTGCGWVGPYSEEQEAHLAPSGRAIAGIWCIGSWCDNKYYWVCNI